jgi:hypothetical protein
MINRRGALVVAIVAAVSVLAGFQCGSFKMDRAWHADWTRLSSTGMICKGDRLK